MDLSWMAWTSQTAIFFGVIAFLLLTFTVLAIKFPGDAARRRPSDRNDPW
jgi:predicted small integral membrane protein